MCSVSLTEVVAADGTNVVSRQAILVWQMYGEWESSPESQERATDNSGGKPEIWAIKR